MEDQLSGGDVRHGLSLGQESDLPGQFQGGVRPNGFACHRDFPTAPGQHSRQGFQQGGLAAAIGADDGGDRSGRNVKADLPQHRMAGITDAQISDLNHGPGFLSVSSEAEQRRGRPKRT